jgi:holo-[acyl-carrier protein] synthase
MEVYGIGTDIVEIDRVKDAMERTPTFKTRVFTEREIAYVEKKKMAYHSYAARFAAKEAVSKAVGTGIRGFSVLDIEILNDELGKPYVILHNKLKTKNGRLCYSD